MSRPGREELTDDELERWIETFPIRGVLVGILAEILHDQRPGHKVAAMFIDTAFGAAIYERLRSLG